MGVRIQMEWIKNMGLKKAFFLLSALGLVVALGLVAIVFDVCGTIISSYPSGGITIDSEGVIRQLAYPTPEQSRIISALEYIRILSCIAIPVGCLGAASFLFYHLKLKTPIAVLRKGTERIKEHDLMFSITEASADELGQICLAFETMRRELVITNKELWRQAEERRRLNAAFAHDLRNPVTVLKGTIKLLRQNREDTQAIDRLETYTLRIEKYVEAMSGIQRLEQIPVQYKAVSYKTLREELGETARLLAPALKIEIDGANCKNCRMEKAYGAAEQEEESAVLDHGLFLTVAENLIGNAARYARERIEIAVSMQEEDGGNGREKGKYLVLSVADDGTGYPAELLHKGPRPFDRTTDDSVHFGMGLYTCQMLCAKHGGALGLENQAQGGAKAVAVMRMGQI